MSQKQFCSKNLGNISVLGVAFVSSPAAQTAQENSTEEKKYVINAYARWGLAFELCLFKAGQGEAFDVLLQSEPCAVPDSYRLLNVYRLYDSGEAQ